MANELYELAVQGIHNNEYVENILHFRGHNLTADDTWNSGKDLITSWHDNIRDPWLACLPETYELRRLAARRVNPKFSAGSHLQFADGTYFGQVSGGATTDNLCPSVRLVPVMGFPKTGRVFMPCIAESDLDNGMWTAGYATNIVTLFTAMEAVFSASSIEWQLAVYSRKNANYALVVQQNLSLVIGYQMRRRRPLA